MEYVDFKKEAVLLQHPVPLRVISVDTYVKNNKTRFIVVKEDGELYIQSINEDVVATVRT